MQREREIGEDLLFNEGVEPVYAGLPVGLSEGEEVGNFTTSIDTTEKRVCRRRFFNRKAAAARGNFRGLRGPYFAKNTDFQR